MRAPPVRPGGVALLASACGVQLVRLSIRIVARLRVAPRRLARGGAPRRAGAVSAATVPALRAGLIAGGPPLWFWTQRLLAGRTPAAGGIGDGVHAWTAPGSLAERGQ